MDWSRIIRPEDLASQIDADYRPYVQAFHAGLCAFLGALPAEVQQRSLARLTRAGEKASLGRRLTILAHDSPVLHKLGQILARNQRLAPALRRELQQLEWLHSTLTRTDIEAALMQEIGPLRDHAIRLADAPLAEASVAVVIPFARLEGHPGRNDPPCEAVFKLLKPGIEERLRLELTLLAEVGALLDEQRSRLAILPLEYEDTFGQVSRSLSDEIRLDLEQRNLGEAADCFADQPLVHIPRLLAPCTPRLTAMERIHGRKLDPGLIDSPAASRQLAELTVRTLLVHPLLTSAATGFFHGDPHAGNLLATKDGRLGVLDWCLAGRLDAPSRRLMSRITLAAMTGQRQRIARLLEQLAVEPITDPAALRAAIDHSLAGWPPGRLPGFSWLVGLLDAVTLEARVRFSPDLLLFRKSLLTLMGVIAELSGDADCLDTVMLREFVALFAAEWPWRWMGGMPHAARTTRLSNADLLDAAWAASFWPL